MFSALGFVRIHIREAQCQSKRDWDGLDTDLVRNATRMLSSAYYFSFACDPFFAKMQCNISSVYGERFIQFDTTLIVEHCHHALFNLCKTYAKDKNIGEFIQFWVEPDYVLTTLNDCQPGLLWVQVSTITRTSQVNCAKGTALLRAEPVSSVIIEKQNGSLF